VDVRSDDFSLSVGRRGRDNRICHRQSKFQTYFSGQNQELQTQEICLPCARKSFFQNLPDDNPIRAIRHLGNRKKHGKI
jgi:hypothetical protein